MSIFINFGSPPGAPLVRKTKGKTSVGFVGHRKAEAKPVFALAMANRIDWLQMQFADLFTSQVNMVVTLQQNVV
jgi:hypothetical protein